MRELKGDQPRAFEEIKVFLDSPGGGMMLLQGYAGTGKTFLMGEIVDYCMYSAKSVAVTAPTHKAVKVIKSHVSKDAQCSTIHSLLGLKEVIDSHGNQTFRPDPMAQSKYFKQDVIIVDEASMIDDIIFEELCKKLGVKVLFVGDPYQIPPVNYVSSIPFSAKKRAEHDISSVSLKEIIRQAAGSPIIQNASSIRLNVQDRAPISQREAVENDLGKVIHVSRAKSEAYFTEFILPMFKSDDYNRDIDYVKVVAWRNKTVNHYNNLIRAYLFGDNIPKIIVGDKLVADAPVIEQNRTLIHTNEEMEVISTSIQEEVLSEEYILKYYSTTVRVFNGGIFNQYVLKIIHEDSEKVFEDILDMQRKVAKSYPSGGWQARSAWIDYYRFIESWHRVKYSYCITAHKSQGSTYHTACVMEYDIKANQDVFERNRILYTACTRPSHELIVMY